MDGKGGILSAPVKVGYPGIPLPFPQHEQVKCGVAIFDWRPLIGRFTKVLNLPIMDRRVFDVSFKRMDIEQLKDADPYTPEADELKKLTEMVVEYEMRVAAYDDNPSKPEPVSQAWLKAHPRYHTTN